MLITSIAQILIALSVTFLWLYLNGDEFTTLTGGWVSQAWSGFASAYTATLPGFSSGASYLGITLPGVDVAARSGVVRVSNLIDLSAISTIRVTLSANLPGQYSGRTVVQKLYLFATDLTTGDWLSPSVYDALSLVHTHTNTQATETLTDVQYTLDVSALTGSYRVCLGFEWEYQREQAFISVSAVEMLAA